MDPNFKSFADELQKLAYGPLEANKVLSLVKRIQLPKASGRIMPGLSGSPEIKSNLKGLGYMMRQMTDDADVIKMHLEAIRATPGISTLTKANRKVIFPGNAGIEQQFARYGKMRGFDAAPTVPAAQKKMLHSIMKGHELDEASVAPAFGVTQFGHRSPDVILREHNRLATLPEGFNDVRKFLQHYRGLVGEAGIMPQGFTYGEGSRLSRHARRHLTKMWNDKTVAFGRANP